MKAASEIQTYLEVIADHSHKVRRDVDGLDQHLRQLSGGFQKFAVRHQAIAGRVHTLISEQRSLQKRLQEVGRKLRDCKSMLATRKS